MGNSRIGAGRILSILGALLTLALLAVLAAPAESEAAKKTRNMMFVGNNWDGTIDVRSPRGNFRKITRINAIPDIRERRMEILTDPERLGYFLAIRELIGEGNDQYVDDMFTNRSGRVLAVSRPSLRDVVGIKLSTGEIKWRFVVDGQRSDHMDVSPDGRRLAVSASTGNVVHILNIRNGKEVGHFPSGDSPHENVYTEDGKRIFHASIGRVYTPTDEPEVDTSKGERYFQVVRARDNKVISRVDMGEKLEQAGYPDMSSAVRPMAITPSERFAYLQVSFFHGFVEYNLKREKVKRIVRLPISEEAAQTPKEQYLLDSAHHGMAINSRGAKLCAAGTMSDYIAIVKRRNFRYKIIKRGKKPYWSTSSPNGKYCFVSWSGTDNVSVINYRKMKEVAHFRVGDHPQRIRVNKVRKSWIKRNG